MVLSGYIDTLFFDNLNIRQINKNKNKCKQKIDENTKIS